MCSLMTIYCVVNANFLDPPLEVGSKYRATIQHLTTVTDYDRGEDCSLYYKIIKLAVSHSAELNILA
jgi:hypothetical protein